MMNYLEKLIEQVTESTKIAENAMNEAVSKMTPEQRKKFGEMKREVFEKAKKQDIKGVNDLIQQKIKEWQRDSQT